MISIASPAAAVSGAAFPVLFGLALGERPSRWALLGLPVALAAIGALSAGDRAASGGPRARSALSLGLLAGLGFGGFFILVSRTAPPSGLWPLVAARLCSLGVLVAVAAARRASLLPPTEALPLAAGAGVMDMAANIFYVLAVRRGLLALVAVMVSHYAAPTVTIGRAHV